MLIVHYVVVHAEIVGATVDECGGEGSISISAHNSVVRLGGGEYVETFVLHDELSNADGTNTCEKDSNYTRWTNTNGLDSMLTIERMELE